MTPTTERTVPIKNNDETGFAEQARAAIKAAMDELEKLGEFLNSSTFEALPEEQRKLLIMQRNTMRNYSWILGKLIELFKPRKEMLSLPVIDMSALAETVIESSRFKDGAR